MLLPLLNDFALSTTLILGSFPHWLTTLKIYNLQPSITITTKIQATKYKEIISHISMISKIKINSIIPPIFPSPIKKHSPVQKSKRVGTSLRQVIMIQLLFPQVKVEQESALIVIMCLKGCIKIQGRRILTKWPMTQPKETKAE